MFKPCIEMNLIIVRLITGALYMIVYYWCILYDCLQISSSDVISHLFFKQFNLKKNTNKERKDTRQVTIRVICVCVMSKNYKMDLLNIIKD